MRPERGWLDRALSGLIGGRSPWMSHALMAPVALWLGWFLLIPILQVLAISFTRRGPYGAIDWHFTLLNYARILEPAYLPVLLRSIGYAGLATGLCLVLGYPVAYALSFFAGRWRAAGMLALMLPFWNSCLLAIYSWMILLGREGLVNNLLLQLGVLKEPVQFLNRPFSVILGLVYFYLPFTVLPLFGCLEKIPRALIEASKDLGAGPATTFWRVTLPLSWPGLVAGALLTFIPCVGDFLTAEFLGGPRTYLIGNLIQNQFLVAQDWPFGSAISAVLLVAMFVGMRRYLRAESVGAGRV